jgi:hypothetical protein
LKKKKSCSGEIIFFLSSPEQKKFQGDTFGMAQHGATMTCTILFVVSKRSHKDIVLKALNMARERVHIRRVAGAEVAMISLGANRCFAVTVCQSQDPDARLEKVRKLHGKVTCNAIVLLNCWLHMQPEDNRVLSNVMLCNSFDMYRDISLELFQGWEMRPMEAFRPIFDDAGGDAPEPEEAEISLALQVHEGLQQAGLVNLPPGAEAAGRNILSGLDDQSIHFNEPPPPGGLRPGMVQWTTPSVMITNRGSAPPGAQAWHGSPFFSMTAMATNEQMERFAADRRRKQGRFGRDPNGIPDALPQGPVPRPPTNRFEAFQRAAAAAAQHIQSQIGELPSLDEGDYGMGDEVGGEEEAEHAPTIIAQRPPPKRVFGAHVPAPAPQHQAPRARTLAERIEDRKRTATIEKTVGSKATPAVKKKVTRLRAEDKEVAAIPTTADENRCMICLDRHVMACAMPCLCFKVRIPLFFPLIAHLTLPFVSHCQFCITCLQAIESAAKKRMDRPTCPACQQEFTSFIQPRCHVNPADEYDRMQSLYKDEPWRYYEERAAAIEDSAKEMRALADQERAKKIPEKKEESPSKKSKSE